MDTTTQNSPRTLILSGSGRYADPWHPFTATSQCLAALLRDAGWQVDVQGDVDRALGDLDDVALLVVNTGDPSRNNDGADPGDAEHVARAAAALDAAIERGIGIIATHTALASLRDYPRYREAIGGSWEPETSWHPPISPAEVKISDTSHPVTAGANDFTLYDEMYLDLITDDDIAVLATHERDGVTHPLVWTRETETRAVACALGHEARAYESVELRRMLQNAARWAARLDG